MRATVLQGSPTVLGRVACDNIRSSNKDGKRRCQSKRGSRCGSRDWRWSSARSQKWSTRAPVMWPPLSIKIPQEAIARVTYSNELMHPCASSLQHRCQKKLHYEGHGRGGPGVLTACCPDRSKQRWLAKRGNNRALGAPAQPRCERETEPQPEPLVRRRVSLTTRCGLFL